MDYELAKQLKDARFPYWEGEPHKGLHPKGKHPIAEFEANSVLVPTLEELIEACGEKFGQLHHYANGKWGATTTDSSFVSNACATPTEAVARLWLALNTKGA
jgi:hypothetical protein